MHIEMMHIQVGCGKLAGEMKKLLCLIVLASLAVTASMAAVADMDDRITDLLQDMTLEQKVGQMTQVNLGVIIDKDVKDRVQFDRHRE